MNIEMVDLKNQYQKIRTEVQAAINDVLDNATFINGPSVSTFKANLETYLDVKHVIPCANGTDALQIAMMALDLKPGDEVITPSFTYIATTEVVALLRLTPVFVEVDAETFCMDPASLEAAITPRTKAIVPVHLYGHSAPMNEILAIAKKHNLYVIEDNAQAIGGKYTFPDGVQKANGTMGTIGCTSFFPSKNLGGYGDGGALYTNDDVLAEKCRKIANHGQKVRYYHELVGCNSRLDSLQAAILDIKLAHLDEYVQARRKAADFYNQAFAGNAFITTPAEKPYTYHAYHQYTLLLKDTDRSALVSYLAGKGIPSMIYYPVPGHRQQMFTSLEAVVHNMDTTDWLTDKVISLPMHTELSTEQQQYICDAVLKFDRENHNK